MKGVLHFALALKSQFVKMHCIVDRQLTTLNEVYNNGYRI